MKSSLKFSVAATVALTSVVPNLALAGNEYNITWSNGAIYSKDGTNMGAVKEHFDNGELTIYSGNKVSLNFGNQNNTHDYSIYGGYINVNLIGGSQDTDTNYNEVDIINATLGGVFGGCAASQSSEGNSVKITNAIVDNVVGGMVQIGTSNKSSVKDNNVTITSSVVHGDVYGGGMNFTKDTYVDKNRVIIKDSQIELGVLNINVYGGRGWSARQNEVYIDNSGIEVSVYGGYGRYEAIENSVTMLSGSINGSVYGGYTSNGNAKENSITISGGSVKSDVAGGYSYTSGNATGNSVTISDGSINGDVHGGYSFSGNATGNSVTISGGSIDGDICGGYSTYSRSTTGNKVYYTGGKISKNILGGNNSNDISGNELFIGTAQAPAIGLSAENVYNFETMNFYLPNSVNYNNTALKLTTTGNTDLSSTKVNAFLSDASNLNGNGVIHLIQTNGKLTGFDPNNTDTSGVAVNVAGLINVKANIELDSTARNLDLSFKGTSSSSSATANANSKQLLENSLAGMIAVNESINNLVSNLDNLGSNANSNSSTNANSQANINENSGEAVVFANIIGHDKRFITGSHVDSKGFSLSSGIVGNDYYNSGKLTTGLFVEYGKAKYESVLDNGLVGEGKTEFIGGGAFGKFKFINNFYTEASARIGNIKTKAEKGMYDEYKLSNTYYGAHFGLGKVFDITSSNELDIYAKYFYSHIAGEEIELRGVNVDLGSVTSSKFKAGFKDTMKFSDTSLLYAGLAYQYEAKGDAKGSLSAFNQSANIASPSLKGGAGIGEIGYTYETN
ncbi:MAG: autotransporter outer membrane beta-barrel domain-containing protein, partial [Campylobacter sp.]|nr:autotransporter outer membrane beta-barrel domain-containing protein [Campylobacter sp.]